MIFFLVMWKNYISFLDISYFVVFFFCRAFTAVELGKKLNGKKFPPNIIKAVITDFRSRYLNLRIFSFSFVLLLGTTVIISEKLTWLVLTSLFFLYVRGLINDGLYAEAFSQSRWSSSTWGPGRIKQVSQWLLVVFFLVNDLTP